MDEDLLSILMCPKTKGTLRLATTAEIEQANALIRAGSTTQEEPLEAGLMCEEGGLIYPVREGIPVLLAAEAIALDPAADQPSPDQ